MISERLIETEKLHPTDTGFSTGIRLPWYRALPLSCVERIAVTVDGAQVPDDAITISVSGVGPLHASELASLIDTYWYVLDSAILTVDWPAATAPGSHNIEVTTGLYIPYLPVDGSPLINLDTCSAQLEVATA